MLQNKTVSSLKPKFLVIVVVALFCCGSEVSCFRGQKMGRFWTLLTHAHSLSGPAVMLLYPLYASVVAIESESKEDDRQWLAYWIIYSFLTLMEMVLQPILVYIPLWYDVKLILVAWLVLPQFRGATFIYDSIVKDKLVTRFGAHQDHSPNSKDKPKKKNFVGFVTHNQKEHE